MFSATVAVPTPGAMCDLQPTGATAGLSFGVQVVLSPNVLYVTAGNSGTDARYDAARVYAYRRNMGGINAWGQVRLLDES